MGFTELLLIAAGLAADAFAVAAADGLCCKNLSRRWIAGIGICFGLMQGIMPLLGYALGNCFLNVISVFDHYIALILLGFIGLRMLFEAIRNDAAQSETQMTVRLLLLQGLATAIDAFAVGISFAAVGTASVLTAVSVIAAVTAMLSITGVQIGRRFGTRFGSGAQVCGGLLLIGIGVRIFLSHILAP